MPSLDRLPEAARQSMLALPIDEQESTPFHRPSKPLAQARVAIVTTAGLHRRDDRPFVPADPTYRLIPSDVAGDELLQSHNSIGFDRTGVMADVNVVFPIDRLREMVAQGRIGELAPTFYSFMGAQRDVGPIRTTSAPEVAGRLVDEGVDVVLLTPT
jgi:D-proline reductase (dithiol) PrdB